MGGNGKNGKGSKTKSEPNGKYWECQVATCGFPWNFRGKPLCYRCQKPGPTERKPKQQNGASGSAAKTSGKGKGGGRKAQEERRASTVAEAQTSLDKARRAVCALRAAGLADEEPSLQAALAEQERSEHEVEALSKPAATTNRLRSAEDKLTGLQKKQEAADAKVAEAEAALQQAQEAAAQAAEAVVTQQQEVKRLRTEAFAGADASELITRLCRMAEATARLMPQMEAFPRSFASGNAEAAWKTIDKECIQPLQTLLEHDLVDKVADLGRRVSTGAAVVATPSGGASLAGTGGPDAAHGSGTDVPVGDGQRG